ncbi:hypothetical protein H4582DRAFT_1198861 [Lactarius indigo]|nr:hypothetical protein H4582DRAFT_1198861 [Lactarius indigo]
MDTPQSESLGCFFFLLFIHSFIHPFNFFSHFDCQLICPPSPASFCSGSSLSLHHICFSLQPLQFNLQAIFTAIVIMQFLYSFHAISHCCHAMPFFISSAAAHVSLSFQRVMNVASTLSYRICFLICRSRHRFFHALNALTAALMLLHSPLSSFDTPHCTLRSCLGTPTCTHLRLLSLTVSANIPRCPSPHVIVHDVLQ